MSLAPRTVLDFVGGEVGGVVEEREEHATRGSGEFISEGVVECLEGGQAAAVRVELLDLGVTNALA
jgi:hypothetical protein